MEQGLFDDVFTPGAAWRYRGSSRRCPIGMVFTASNMLLIYLLTLVDCRGSAAFVAGRAEACRAEACCAEACRAEA